jgi:hypothetical protein
VTSKAEFLAHIRQRMPSGQGAVTAGLSERPAHPAEAAEIIRRQLRVR